MNGRLEQREYETREGEKRNVVEVVADEIGPSLRWATAQVERNDRRSTEGGGSFGGARERWRRQAAPAPPDIDEEPF